jgi:DMSO/TMAO reductase YedYZ molybdopterin-dependent catalytic subunit
MAVDTEIETRTSAADGERPGAARAAIAGVLASAVALGVSELLAGIAAPVPSLVVAIGGAIIDRAPPSLERTAIEIFGTADKVALVAGILLVAAVSGALLGIAAARRFSVAVAGFAAFGLLAVLAAAADAQASVPLALASVALAAAAGLGTLRRLLDAAPARAPVEPTTREPRGADRRSFLRLAFGAAALAGVSGVVGRMLQLRSQVSVARESVDLPAAGRDAIALPDDVDLDIEGLAPYITPNEDFYRIDTALMVPRVDPASWQLAIAGMVERPYTLTYDELLALPQVEIPITIACVSNEVGGGLIGNAVWQGARLGDVLERAGVQVGATQIVGRSVDGWTAGFPTELAFDGRDALIAVGMNGEPLPLEHGFPARLVVPGVYGYVSATKWLSEIALTTLEAFDAYWIPRGWAKLAPIKTQSRIDVPRGGARLEAGRQPIAGVAWAQQRGIAKVEVSIDDGPWREARLADALSDDTWRQWVLEWDAEPGRHVLQVRATDETGETQTAERAPVMPDGATGYHTVRVQVT